MKLMELEQQLGISFPKKFHEIYETGAMKWLEMNSEQIQKNRNDYLQDTKAFLMLNCDCEPYSFDEISEAMDTLTSSSKKSPTSKVGDELRLIQA